MDVLSVREVVDMIEAVIRKEVLSKPSVNLQFRAVSGLVAYEIGLGFFLRGFLRRELAEIFLESVDPFLNDFRLAGKFCGFASALPCLQSWYV